MIGSGSTFSYSNFSSSEAWNGLNGGTIGITNQDTQKYGYHLYTYTNSTDPLVSRTVVKDCPCPQERIAPAFTAVAGVAIIFEITSPPFT